MPFMLCKAHAALMFLPDPWPQHFVWLLMQLNVKYTMVPDWFPNLPRSNLSIPAEVVPAIPDAWCSSFYLDTTPTKCAA